MGNCRAIVFILQQDRTRNIVPPGYIYLNSDLFKQEGKASFVPCLFGSSTNQKLIRSVQLEEEL